jgi:hypothetical protein
MEREKTQKILKHEQVLLKRKQEQTRLEKEKQDKKLQKMAIALHQNEIPIDKISGYPAWIQTKFLFCLKTRIRESCFHNTFIFSCIFAIKFLLFFSI